MSLIHPEGSTCSLGELDLHAVPYSQKDIVRSQLVTKTPNNALTDTSTSFDLTFKSNNLYTDISEVEIYLEATHDKADRTAQAIEETSVPVNNQFNSLFDSLQIHINGEKVNSNKDEYSDKAYLKDLLGTQLEDKNSHLQGCHN